MTARPEQRKEKAFPYIRLSYSGGRAAAEGGVPRDEFFTKGIFDRESINDS
jgi:hypothetical protein